MQRDDGFGELRSLMQRDSLGEDGRAVLWELMVAAHQRDAPDYEARWLPYMRGFPHHFRAPLATLTDLDQLEQVAPLAPCPCLAFKGRDLGAEGAKALAQSEQLRSLTSLGLFENEIGDEGARALAASENLSSLTTLELSGNELGERCEQELSEHEHISV